MFLTEETLKPDAEIGQASGRGRMRRGGPGIMGQVSFPWPPEKYLPVISEQSARLAAAAVQAGLAAPVPTCPGWQVATLVRHVGVLHRWVAAAVRDPAAARPDRGAFDPGPLPGDWAGWLVEGSAALVRALAGAGANRAAWTLLGRGRTAFWFRRMAHETAIHRFDAEVAADRQPGPTLLPSPLATDGIDEFWNVQLDRKLRRSPVAGLAGTVRWQAADAGHGWTVRLDGASATVLRDVAATGASPADGTITGPAAELLLFAWNRVSLTTATVSGDRRLFDAWSRLVRL
jgi:uncharacterized protein (TIGR03083 family)